MLIYMAHAYGGKEENLERASKIAHDLQLKMPKDCIISPLSAFSHLGYEEMGKDEAMELCLDLLSACDKLLVASEISEGVQREIDFARLVDMEVEYIEPQNPGRCDEQ